MRRLVFVRGLTGLAAVATVSAMSLAASPGDLVITEIMNNPSEPGTGGPGDANGEWFEIYNASGSTIDLEGFEIRDDGTDSHEINTGGAGLDIAPGQYLVLGVNDNTLFNGGAPVDYEYVGITLANGDDEIELVEAGVVIDRVAYDGGPSFPDPNGASMNLDPMVLTPNGATANDSGFNWCESTSMYGTSELGTPGAANDACVIDPDVDGDGVDNELDNCPTLFNPGQLDCDDDMIGDLCTIADGLQEDCNLNDIPDNCDIAMGAADTNMNGIPDLCEGPPASNALVGELVITEILQNPNAVADSDGEWFEIVNDTASKTIELAGLTFSDNVGSFTLPNSPSRSLAPGEFYVFGNNDDTGTNGGVTVDFDYGEALFLANGSDQVTIRNGMALIDEVVWDDGNTFPDPTGASMNLDPTRTDAAFNDLGVNWCEATSMFGDGDLGTPGATNDSCMLGDDSDEDGVPDDVDNCPDDPNTDQADCDLDGIGDVCEIDGNMNGIPDDCETGWVINEVLFFLPNGPDGDANNDGVTDFNDDEFVEIVNNTGSAKNISGWILSDSFSQRHLFPNGTVLEDQCSIVIFGGGVPTGPFGGSLVQTSSTGSLGFSSGGDTISLANGSGTTVASLVYGPLPGGNTGESIVRDPDITGLEPLVLHSTATGAGGALYSAGTLITGSPFPGCPPPADSDNDGIFDLNDNCPDDMNPDQADCDGDNIGDVCEILDGLALDCNSNGVPDNCEVADTTTTNDCNGNGVPDDCDFVSGILTDNNEDGVPDQCFVVPPATLRINEIRIGQPGADIDEYFELTADPGADLDGIRYIVIGDGAPADGSGVIEAIVNLDGRFMGLDGNFVVAEDTFSLALFGVDLSLPAGGLNFEEFDNVTHLLVANFTGELGQDLDTNDDGTLDVVPWLTEIDRIALVLQPNPPTSTEYHYGPPMIGPDTTFVPSYVYRCTPSGDWEIGPFDPTSKDALDTPGSANAPCMTSTCPWDLNTDDSVGFADLTTLLNSWGPCISCPADFNMDDSVGFADLTALLNRWGPCPVGP